MADKTEICPSCGEILPVHPGYVTWCHVCRWNIDPQVYKSTKEKIWSRLNTWMGVRRTESLYEEVRQEHQPGFRMTPFRILSYFVAGLWYVFILWLAYKAFILLSNSETMGMFLEGILLGILVLLLAPRVYRLKQKPLDRLEYPAIYQVVEETAALLGAEGVDGVVANRSFQAFYTLSGLGRKKLLIVGLPLFAGLTKEEKLAVLAHELGHHANKDITRSSFLNGVQMAWGRMFMFLYPKTDYTEMFAFLATWIAWLRKGVAHIALVPWYLLGVALWRDSQRAEYYADYAAASIAGSQAASSCLEKLGYAPTYYKTVENVAQFGYTPHLFEEYRSRIRTVPPRELERLRILSESMDMAVESTHPPVHHRIAYIRDKLSSSQAVIAPVLLEQMEKEFRSLEAQVEKRIIHDYRGT